MKPINHRILLLLTAIVFSSFALTAQATKTDVDLSQRMLERRAVEAVIWGLPAVNFDRMHQAALNAGAKPNQIVYWSRPIDWKNQLFTPNPNTIYLMPFIDTTEVGPVVLEIPPVKGGAAIVGSIDDVWQMPYEDVGTAGADVGKGGKYLILPPNYTGVVPEGYIPIRAKTYKTYGLMRSNIEVDSKAGIAKAVEYAKRMKLYPLSEAGNNPKTTFVDSIDKLYDATIPYDFRFYEALNRIVQTEPWLTRDKAMIDTLKYIGIEKGKPFAPDAQTKEILEAAIVEAHHWLDYKYDAGFAGKYLYNKGTHWALPVFPDVIPEAQNSYAGSDTYPLDARAITYTYIFFAPKVLGTGQFYFFGIKDSKGKDLEGSKTYRLRVPANAPVKQYWSVVAYDRVTHALIRNMPSAGIASNMPEVQKNADDSVDVWFGPKAPAGKKSNWIPTNADGRFELVFRFYGPKPSLFDKTWVLPDLEKVE